MDDLVQVLFFLVTLGLFIFSAIRKQKKQPNQKESQPNLIDNTFESLFGIPIEDKNTMPKNTLTHEKEISNNPVNVISDEEVFIDQKDEQSEELIEPTEPNTIPYNFDLKSAIIYNEILNRKHF